VLRTIQSRAPFAYVAVDTAGGPHVTPVLYGITPDRVWLVVQRATLKARVLARRPGVGVLLDAGEHCIAIRGQARIIDPLSPAGLVARAPELARAPCAVPSYLTRNAPELIAFPRDLGLRPPDIVFAAIEPDEVVPVQRPATTAREEIVVQADAPAHLLALARRAGPAVIALEAPGGPIALPAAWDPVASTATVPAAHLPADLHEARVAVCFDVSRGRGPAAKAGVLLRGAGGLTGSGEIAVAVDRVTWWDGLAVATVAATGALPAAA
jgi:hypothetical protein